MDVTHAILCPQPPPTSNNLDAHQRARLVRSTRKLGAILGTTPHLLEVDVDAYIPPTTLTYRPDTPQSVYHTKRARRHASVFSVFPPSGASSTTSFESSCSNTLSSSYTSSSSSASKNSSVTSFTIGSDSDMDSTHALPTPKSFSSKHRRTATDSSRPRPLMLRLNAIPVAPSDPRLPTSPLPSTPTQSRALKTSFGFFPEEEAMTPLTPVFPAPSELRRRKMAKLTRTLGENVPPELVFSLPQPEAQSIDAPQTPRAPTRRRKASMSVDENAGRPSSQIWVTGMKGWRGEWNRKDIKEVQQGLRNLRSR